MIATAAKDTMLMGTVCVCREGDSPWVAVRLRPPPCSSPTVSTLMSPQMMAGIIMNRMMMDDADRAVNMEDPTGVSFWTGW